MTAEERVEAGAIWPQQSTVLAVLLMSASVRLITALPKPRWKSSLWCPPACSTCPIKSWRTQFTTSPSPSFFLFSRLDCLVFTIFHPSPTLFESRPLTGNWQREIQAACGYCICHIQYLGHIYISFHLGKWVRKEYLWLCASVKQCWDVQKDNCNTEHMTGRLK